MPADFVMATDQPYGVEIHTADGIFVKQYIIPKAGTFIPSHSHAWDHTSMLAVGSMRVWKDGIYDDIYSAPCGIFIKSGVKHTFQTLSDNTMLYCIHNLHGADAVKVLEEHQLLDDY